MMKRNGPGGMHSLTARRARMGYVFVLPFAFGLLAIFLPAVIILGLCYVILYPFFVKTVTAFMPYQDLLDPTVRFVPKHFTLDNLRTVFSRLDYGQTLLNTSLLSVGTALLTTMISSFVAYGFARYAFKGNGLLFAGVILTLIVPPQTIIIPLFLRFRFFAGFLNLLDTPLPIVILSLTGLSLKNGLFIFMLRQFYKNLPHELEEAAWLDGCGAMDTYFRVMLPSARTLLITVFLLSLSWNWTDTLYAPLFLPGVQLFANMVGMSASGESPIMAGIMQNLGALLAVLPLALIYIVLQKFFVQSVERAGIVG